MFSLSAASPEATKLVERLNHLTAALEKGLPEAEARAARYERRRIFELFGSNGRNGDFDEWADIADSTLEGRKVRKTPDPVLWDEGNLMRQFADPHLEGGKLWFETDAPGARALDEGYDANNLPAREFGYIPEEDQETVPEFYQRETERLLDS
jgi:hypothetical protein